MIVKNVSFKIQEQDQQIIERFGPYKTIFENLIEKCVIQTSFQDMVGCIFSNDSTRIVALLKESEEKYSIVMYCTETYKMLSSISLQGEYIKAKYIS